VDGQRHTILLTIAMLAESDVPLVIDQPEDDSTMPSSSPAL
jgi:alpha-D-ribose 1-methylphosphonate 5-phosphate C-P lyase